MQNIVIRLCKILYAIVQSIMQIIQNLHNRDYNQLPINTNDAQ
jgi:hypothetical protein